MTAQQAFRFWRDDPFFDDATRAELAKLDEAADAKEIEDRFYRSLDFGTGGLRGVMGAGTNRINRYTVGKATLGLGCFLLDRFSSEECARRGVAIAYDTRNRSAELACTAADVLTALGIRVLLSRVPIPTPQLSFTIKHLHCVAGVVITASHNPKEYNGYKVYDEFGCQLVPHQAKQVTDCIDAVQNFSEIPSIGDPALCTEVDTTKAFVDAVLRQSRVNDPAAKAALKVIYTPLHGTGNRPVRMALERDGFTDVTVVAQQKPPDGAFPTVQSPNPEERSAMTMGFALAEQMGADLVLGTDPDCDRVGVGVRSMDGAYRLLTGNQIGALLMDFILSHTALTALHKPAAIKTVVTGELGAAIARKHGLSVFDTLTGFKYIGEKITQFQNAAESGDDTRDFTFVFGYEESCGFLCGTHAQEKDAVVSALLICEMAAACKKQGTTLLERLQQLYRAYGYYREALDSFTMKGKDGLQQIQAVMRSLRQRGSPFPDTAQIVDFSTPIAAEPGFGTLPAGNVLKYILADGSWVAVRPSGTEPKIKVYYSVKSADEPAAEKRLTELRRVACAALGVKGTVC